MSFLLASASRGLPKLPGQTNVITRNFGEVFLVLGAMTLVVGLIVIWAVYFRKPKTDKRKVLEPFALKDSTSSSGKKRRRKRRRPHRPRNPTLAETGGLPPPKIDSTDSP